MLHFALDTANLHPTTSACLGSLQTLHETREFTNILEIGCGNGILSVAAAYAWPASVLAADIAQKAVDDTHAQIAHYGLQERVVALRSDGFSHPEITKRAPYDLIICNLLADVHIAISADMVKNLAPGGCVLLSGILEWRMAELEQVMAAHSLRLDSKTIVSPWVTYIYGKLS